MFTALVLLDGLQVVNSIPAACKSRLVSRMILLNLDFTFNLFWLLQVLKPSTPVSQDSRFKVHSTQQAACVAQCRLLAKHRPGWLASHYMPSVPIRNVACLTGRTRLWQHALTRYSTCTIATTAAAKRNAGGYIDTDLNILSLS